MKTSGFNFKFVSTLNIRQQKVNAPKGSFITLPDWLRYKIQQIYKMMMDVFSMFLWLHSTAIKNSKIIFGKYQILNH